MEITLEKIELVKDRTGASYKEAKAALEKTEGSVVDAIILIEEDIDVLPETKTEKSVSKIVQDVKDVVKKGNVTKILIKKDDEVILNIPVNIGILGVIVVPWVSIISAVTALGFKCSISVVKKDGEVVDIVEKAVEKFGGVKENCSDLYDEIKEKGGEAVSKVKEKAENVKSRVRSEDEDEENFDDDYFNFDDEYPDIDESGECKENSCEEEASPADEIKISDIIEEEGAQEEAEDMFKLFDAAVEKTEEPEMFSEAPEEFTETPEEFIEEPEKFTEAPEEFIEEPEKFTEAPEEFTEEPEKFTEAPEAFDAAEEISRIFEEPADAEEAAEIPEVFSGSEEIFEYTEKDNDVQAAEKMLDEKTVSLESLIDELIKDDENLLAEEEESDDLMHLLDEIEKYGAEADDVMKEAEEAIEDTDFMTMIDEEPEEERIIRSGSRKKRFRFFR